MGRHMDQSHMPVFKEVYIWLVKQEKKLQTKKQK